MKYFAIFGRILWMKIINEQDGIRNVKNYFQVLYEIFSVLGQIPNLQKELY